MPGKVGLTDLDMWARAVPYAKFARLRREDPVAWSPHEPRARGGAYLAGLRAAGRRAGRLLGAPPLITRQDQVAPLVLRAAGPAGARTA